jgi:tRNA-specific 2-thiouridylase
MYNLKDMFFWKNKKEKVLVAMSGGVDSSVAALLLKKRGFEVAGGFIRGYNVDGCQDRDAEDARLVAQKIGIPFYVFNFEDEYKKRVVDYLLEGYKKGITPNPDVVCNKEIKFGLFYNKAIEIGFDFVASGHYALLKRGIFNNQIKIYTAKDKNKDQSYFLWDIPRQKFEKIIFPLGNLKKVKVREIARKAQLPTAEKKDSQGICFLGKFDFGDFLRENIKVKIGDIVDVEGKKVGEHDGVWLYTIGQKHGFRNFSGRSFYVIAKNIDRNELIVDYEGSKNLYCKEFEVNSLNFLDIKTEENFKLKKPIEVLVRNRYRQALQKAILLKVEDSKAKIELKKPDKIFPASGQSAVFYKKDGQMLGGGIIV